MRKHFAKFGMAAIAALFVGSPAMAQDLPTQDLPTQDLPTRELPKPVQGQDQGRDLPKPVLPQNAADAHKAAEAQLQAEMTTPQSEIRMGVMLGQSAGAGVLVTDVQPGSPAFNAGLRRGDYITKVGQEKVSDPNGVMPILQGQIADDRVELEIWRDSRAQPLTIDFRNRSTAWVNGGSQQQSQYQQQPQYYDNDRYTTNSDGYYDNGYYSNGSYYNNGPTYYQSYRPYTYGSNYNYNYRYPYNSYYSPYGYNSRYYGYGNGYYGYGNGYYGGNGLYLNGGGRGGLQIGGFGIRW